MLYSWETILAMIGLIVIFLTVALIAALILQLWSPGNRYGPEGNPYRYGTFKWCWEMGLKFAGTVLMLLLGVVGVIFFWQIFLVPLINTF